MSKPFVQHDEGDGLLRVLHPDSRTHPLLTVPNGAVLPLVSHLHETVRYNEDSEGEQVRVKTMLPSPCQACGHTGNEITIRVGDKRCILCMDCAEDLRTVVKDWADGREDILLGATL